jgi:hypothetical protein
MVQKLFSESDIRQIEDEGLTVDAVTAQIQLFEMGTLHIKLHRPCTIGDGIVSIAGEDMSALVALCEEGMHDGRILKFVPASGAASRMFKRWYQLRDACGEGGEVEGTIFAAELQKYAFLDDLKHVIEKKGDSLEGLIKENKYGHILACILTQEGLNYGSLPKALLKFHRYPHGVRTALEEHLVEATLYAQDVNRVCRMHFTVSEEHEEGVGRFISEIKNLYEGHFGVTFDVTLSAQHSFTNTIAVDMENRPLRNALGQLIFRPGGHGALLNNLNDLDADIVFLKNIDNVVPDRLKPTLTLYKKILGGCLIKMQNEVFRYIRLLHSGRIDEDLIKDIVAFCVKNIHIVFPVWFQSLPLPEKCTFLFETLNRPLRVCGMVKNEGEPGGGPYWIENKNGTGTLSLQIIEESQIDTGLDEQKAIWVQATHFNPVDLACGVRDYRNQKFDLQDYVDKDTYFISKKSEQGRDLKALELPGLWNGAMAFWNTIFIEVPIETFNPVKTVEDLLRPQHLMDE